MNEPEYAFQMQEMICREQFNYWSVVFSPLSSSTEALTAKSASAPGICRWGSHSRGSASCSSDDLLESAWGQPGQPQKKNLSPYVLKDASTVHKI